MANQNRAHRNRKLGSRLVAAGAAFALAIGLLPASALATAQPAQGDGDAVVAMEPIVAEDIIAEPVAAESSAANEAPVTAESDESNGEPAAIEGNAPESRELESAAEEPPASAPVDSESDGAASDGIIMQAQAAPSNRIEHIAITVEAPATSSSASATSAASRVSAPPGQHFSVRSASWVSRTASEIYAPFNGVFEAGQTYYMAITLVADADAFWNQAIGPGEGVTAAVTGATQEGPILTTNSTEECTASIVVSFQPAPDSGYTDVYVDHTVDASRSYVTGVAHITGSGGLAEHEGFEREIYNDSIGVAYSNPKPDEVQSMIDDAYNQTQAFAQSRKDNGKNGEISMSTSEIAGEAWDNRTYANTYSWTSHPAVGEVTYSHTDSNGIDYFKDDTGTYSINERGVTRQFEAAGEYGKNTYYRVEANGHITAYDIVTSKMGNGTVTVSPDSTALRGDMIEVTLQADSGWVLDEVRIGTADSTEPIVGAVYEGLGQASDSLTFAMPAGDVTVSVRFKERGSAAATTDTPGGGNTSTAGSGNASASTTTVRPAAARTPATSATPATPATGDSIPPVQGALLLAACSGLVLALATWRLRMRPAGGAHARR